MELVSEPFPFGDVADITLDDLVMIDQVNITDKLHGDVPSVFCLEREVFVADIPCTL